MTHSPLTPEQRGEAFTGSESYADGRMTHDVITSQTLSQVQSEVVHDALMAAFQAGFLFAAEGTSVEDLLARMAALNEDNDPRDPGDRNWWEVTYLLDGQESSCDVIADDESYAKYYAQAGFGSPIEITNVKKI